MKTFELLLFRVFPKYSEILRTKYSAEKLNSDVSQAEVSRHGRRKWGRGTIPLDFKI